MRPRDPCMTISMRPVGFLCVRDAGLIPINITDSAYFNILEQIS